METLWLLIALWIGFVAGFFLCALMTMARDRPRQTASYLPPHVRRAHN